MPTLLHVGCGQKRKRHTTAGFNTPEWNEVRLDIDPAVSPDIVAAMTDMTPVADESVDAVYSSHNIEHLYAHEVPVALAEFRRVLKPDGFVVITCPDLRSVAALIAQDRLGEPAYVSPAGPISPHDILYGHGAAIEAGNLFMAHHCGFTCRTLVATLQRAGFGSIAGMQQVSAYALWALASKAPRPREAMQALVGAHFPLSPPRAASA